MEQERYKYLNTKQVPHILAVAAARGKYSVGISFISPPQLILKCLSLHGTWGEVEL